MYDGVKQWLNVSYIRKPFLSFTGGGTKHFGDEIPGKCYPAAKTTKVFNDKGDEVISSSQLHINGTVDINIQDSILFEGRKREILSVATFYDELGKPDLKVVYLK